MENARSSRAPTRDPEGRKWCGQGWEGKWDSQARRGFQRQLLISGVLCEWSWEGGLVREWLELRDWDGGARGQGSCHGGVLKYKLSLQTV